MSDKVTHLYSKDREERIAQALKRASKGEEQRSLSAVWAGMAINVIIGLTVASAVIVALDTDRLYPPPAAQTQPK